MFARVAHENRLVRFVECNERRLIISAELDSTRLHVGRAAAKKRRKINWMWLSIGGHLSSRSDAKANIKFTPKSEKYFHMREHIDNGSADPQPLEREYVYMLALCSIFKRTWNKWEFRRKPKKRTKNVEMCSEFYFFLFLQWKTSELIVCSSNGNHVLVLHPSVHTPRVDQIELWSAWNWKT